MHSNWLTVAASGVLTLATLTGCSEQSQQPDSAPAAKLTLGGEEQTLPRLTCTQFKWWSIAMSDGERSLSAAVDLWEGDSTAKFVKIRDIDGFTGSYWEGGVGNATTTFADGIFTITGDVYGISDREPNKTTTIPFELVAPC